MFLSYIKIMIKRLRKGFALNKKENALYSCVIQCL